MRGENLMISVSRAFVVLSALLALAAACGETSTIESESAEGFVCGSDGNSYSLQDADTGGHEVAHRGRCDEPMACDSQDDCFVGDACTDTSGAAFCVPGPNRCDCPGLFEPVCGGDGRNYVNGCEASCAAVGLQHDGYCESPAGRGCVRAGCSDHLCVEEGMDIASTCEWRPAYACYQQAACARQENGQCGFTPTHELVECLDRHGEGMCRIDPSWQNGFQAECESRQIPGIVGVVAVEPLEALRLGEPFLAGYELLEPPVFGGQYEGDGVLDCIGDEVRFQGIAHETPLGPLEFECRVLAEVVDPCALVDCAPGYYCERGECVPECLCTDIYLPVCGVDGVTYGNGCEAGCLGVEIAYEGECDADCRTRGCEDGGTCENCPTEDGTREWICLPPNAGACEPPDECRPTGCNGEICASQDMASPCVALPEFACYADHGACELQPWGECGWTNTPALDQCLSEFDCRSIGCAEGEYCTLCWFEWACVLDGVAC